MKTSIKTIMLAGLVTAGFFGCSKKNSDNVVPLSGTPSTWTITGSSYTATNTVFTNNELLSVDDNNNTQPDIGLQFNARPVAGNYTVVDQLSTVPGANQVAIETSNGAGTATLFSTGGGTVTVTISNGKIVAVYTNVAMGAETGFDPNSGFTFAPAGTSNGKLVEQ